MSVYARPAFVPVPKPQPRIVGKVTKRRKVAAMDRKEKEKVRQRDQEARRQAQAAQQRRQHRQVAAERERVAETTPSTH
jgi:hypothetical protein